MLNLWWLKYLGKGSIRESTDATLKMINFYLHCSLMVYYEEILSKGKIYSHSNNIQL